MSKLYAVPVVGGRFSSHFGHCDQFAMIQVEDNKIVKTNFVDSPEHQQGSYPAWLKEQGANVVIAGGMGPMAQQRFVQYGIELFLQAQGSDPVKMVEDYLKGQIETGGDACDHDSPSHQNNCH